MKRLIVLAALGLLALACGSSGYTYRSSSPSPPPPSEVYTASGSAGPVQDVDVQYELATEGDDGVGFGGGWDGDYFEDESPETRRASVSDVVEEARPRMAKNVPRQQQQAQQVPPQEGEPPETSDGIDLSGPLLIYTATFHLGVYEVTQTQEAILEQLAELDVILSRRSDTELVVRVPTARFQQAVDLVEGAGDVLHREVNVQDVGEEFRDVAIRLRNAEVMRDRLEALLARADEVEDALAIERELQRLTDIIERFKGRQRFLADQIRFSTITIVFQALSTEPTGPDGFTLPFDWLSELGLSNLMRLQ